MRIFIIGGTGFIGRALIDGFKAEGHKLSVLLRSQKLQNDYDGPDRYVSGNPLESGKWQDTMVEHDVVINLAGATIFRRWSDRIKAEILNSRIATTRNVVEAIRNAQHMNIQLFNASGIGYYGYRRDEVLDEYARPGDTFLARVAVEWESEAMKAEGLCARVVLCRFGIVLGKSGGALGRIAGLVRFYLGGKWGDGEQWFSWIHEKDMADAFLFLLKNPGISGAINFTAPEPVRNSEMIDTFKEVLKKRAIINTVPRGFLRLIIGEFSNVFLNGQRAIPYRLNENGFVYGYPVLKQTLADLLR